MEDDFYINLADCVFGPEEIELLLKEWLKDPQPKTVNELARMYLTHRWETQTGFLPYDRRKLYKEKDKIAVRLNDEIQPAQVVSVSTDALQDSDGFRCDEIKVRLLSQTEMLAGQENRSFIANYQGEIWAGPNVGLFEVVQEKDETEVIPKILQAISSDDRFVAFEEKWLPSELLVRDVSYKLSDIEKVIAKCKQALSTSEILEKVQTDDNREELNSRLEFSLNHFLSKDKDRRFVQIPDSITKWYLRTPPEPVEVPTPSGEKESTVTISAEWLEKDILVVPRKLSVYMGGTNTVHILYNQVDEVLPYEEGDRLIEGIGNFYSAKAIAEGDKVHLRLETGVPTKLFVYSRWKRSLNELLRIPPQDLDWEYSSLRDCIIVVLSKFKTPAHYREIYKEIANHKDISIGATIATLSKYSPSVFAHVCRGKWTLAGWAKQVEYPEREPTENKDYIEVSKELWQVVCRIEENDYVYKLLEKIGKPLSFDEICSRLADYLKVDVHELRATGFLKADDKRFRRLDNGTWVLEEWFPRDGGQEGPVEKHPEETSKHSRLWLLLIILLILLFSSMVVGGILIWLFLYGR